MSTGEMTDRQIEEYEMTPIERFIVVLASFGNKAEVHHLRLFFQEWETSDERIDGVTEILRQLANLAEDRKAA